MVELLNIKVTGGQRYVFKSHDRWQECYSINKTSIRKNYSGVTEIVELKSK